MSLCFKRQSLSLLMLLRNWYTYRQPIKLIVHLTCLWAFWAEWQQSKCCHRRLDYVYLHESVLYPLKRSSPVNNVEIDSIASQTVVRKHCSLSELFINTSMELLFLDTTVSIVEQQNERESLQIRNQLNEIYTYRFLSRTVKLLFVLLCNFIFATVICLNASL